MVPMSSNKSSNNTFELYNQNEKTILLQAAKKSILHGLESGSTLPVTVAKYSVALQSLRATFVTLNKSGGELRGCIGNLTAQKPLIESVVANAYAAAFEDPRFPSLIQSEFSSLSISLSILSPPEPIRFTSEADLISKIRPKIDGLILQEGYHRGTFLPSVWASLPDPKIFFQQLKQKANLPLDYWSDTIKVDRYTADVID